MKLTTNFFEMKTDESDWPRKHPLYASVVDPGRYSLMEEVEASKKTNSNIDTWYHVFIQFMLPCGTGSFLDASLDESQVKQACTDSSFYGGGKALYNPRCAEDDALINDGYGCGPQADLGTLTALEHTLAVEKATTFATQDPTAITALASPLIPVCTAWPVQSYRCDGTECFGPRELTPGLYDAIQRNETVVLGLHPKYFYPCFDWFLNADNANSFRSPNFNCVHPDDPNEYLPCTSLAVGSRIGWRGGGPTNSGDMDHTSTVVWAQNLRTGENWLSLTSSVRKHVNNFVSNTNLKSYPGSDFWIFWYQYRFIEDTLRRAAAVAICGLFALAVVFFLVGQPPGTALKIRCLEAITLALFFIATLALFVLTFISAMGLADLWFNSFTLATIIISLGIAVEFVAHTSTAYLVALGTAAHRAQHAAAVYVLPIFDGGFTTFLGVAPLAASAIVYINLYYFRLYAILVAIGITFGVLFYPAILATLGRSSSPEPSSSSSRKNYITPSSPFLMGTAPKHHDLELSDFSSSSHAVSTTSTSSTGDVHERTSPNHENDNYDQNQDPDSARLPLPSADL